MKVEEEGDWNQNHRVQSRMVRPHLGWAGQQPLAVLASTTS